MDEFGLQSKLVRKSFTPLPVTAQTGFSQLIKGSELKLRQNVLLVARCHKLEGQSVVITKRETRKKRRF
jgi:hypothetical protein